MNVPDMLSLFLRSPSMIPTQVSYPIIEQGVKVLYRTFEQHIWIMRDQATGSRLVMNGCVAFTAGPVEGATVKIDVPPLLRWTVRVDLNL